MVQIGDSSSPAHFPQCLPSYASLVSAMCSAPPAVSPAKLLSMPPLETSKISGSAVATSLVVTSTNLNNNNNSTSNLNNNTHHGGLAHLNSMLMGVNGSVVATTGAAATGQNVSATSVAGGGMHDKKGFSDGGEPELTDLATQEISLDLQGLIDDTHFSDENLFGELMEATTKNKNDMNNGGQQMVGGPVNGAGGNMVGEMGWMGMVRGGGTPCSTSGTSSGQHSPAGSEGHNSPPSSTVMVNNNGGGAGGYSTAAAAYQARNTLAYLPGSVHNGANFNHVNHVNHHSHHNNNIQVKQEPPETDYSSACSVQQLQAMGPQQPTQSYSNNNNPNATNNNTNTYSSHQGVVSSSTHPPSSSPPVLPYGMGGPLPSLKAFAQHQQSKYLAKKKSGGGDKSTDEYRKRRERNNVAVRKSREKAKLRSRETEERVKILARENDRLQKKVELLQEELTVFRSLFTNVGVLPDHVHRDLSKHLENFQAQHAAINY